MPSSPREYRRWHWLAGTAALLSVLACYGTLALVAILASLGVTLAVNVHAWAAIIVLLALLAVIGVALGWRQHGDPRPLAIAITGALLVIFAMYGSRQIESALGLNSLVVEFAGFAGMLAAAVWDWRARQVG